VNGTASPNSVQDVDSVFFAAEHLSSGRHSIGPIAPSAYNEMMTDLDLRRADWLRATGTRTWAGPAWLEMHANTEGPWTPPDKFISSLEHLGQVRNDLLAVIYDSNQLTFPAATAALATHLEACSPREIQLHLLHCGIIPETFAHSGTEEKLFAKASDIIVARAFHYMGLRTAVLTRRNGEADVRASSATYALVADAKAFRLSRSARSPKDFKISALSGWRGDHDYALLIAPRDQYPAHQSAIYEEARAHHVSLLSFAHLLALTHLVHEAGPEQLSRFFAGFRAKSEATSAPDYWRLVDALFTAIPDGASTLSAAQEADGESRAIVCQRELDFLRLEQERLETLTRDELLSLLRASKGLQQRIQSLTRLPIVKADRDL
jgi:hypothetical protein